MKLQKIAVILILVLLIMLSISLLVFSEEEKVTLNSPVAVTTCGQSPGALMLKLICKKANVECFQSNDLSVADLQNNSFKTLIITTGTSMKGMGAAGTDIKAEIKRIDELIAEARKQGIVIIGAHIEGMARRVDKYDEMSIEAVAPAADIILVKEDSDADGYFSKLAEEKNIPIIKVKETLDLQGTFKDIFQVQ